jgi:hypothetical protein
MVTFKMVTKHLAAQERHITIKSLALPPHGALTPSEQAEIRVW